MLEAIQKIAKEMRDAAGDFESWGRDVIEGYASRLEALQADAREKGEAVVRLYPEELARMTHGPSLRLDEEDRLRSIYGDIAIPLYLHSGDYTEAMLLLEKQRELVENLRGQLDDAKADATDGCTEANCERCNTAIHSRGDMRHAGIGTYPATQPAQASEATCNPEYAAPFYAACERAASDLPEGWEIRICLESGAGTVELVDPDGEVTLMDEDSENRMTAEVHAAIDAAIATSSQETASE